MGAMASQITSLATVYLTVYSGSDQRKYQSSASLAFVREIHQMTIWMQVGPNFSILSNRQIQCNENYIIIMPLAASRRIAVFVL